VQAVEKKKKLQHVSLIKAFYATSKLTCMCN